jgi:hypothetical protein
MNEILAIVRPAPPRRSIPPPQEIEIKLAASPAMLENLRHHPLLGEAARAWRRPAPISTRPPRRWQRAAHRCGCGGARGPANRR